MEGSGYRAILFEDQLNTFISVTSTPDELERRLRGDSRASVLFENLQRSIRSGHLPSKVGDAFRSGFNQKFSNHLTRASAEPSPRDLRQLVINALEEICDADDLEPLHKSFQAVHGTSLDFGRILTQMTLRERCIEDPRETDSFGFPVSMDPLDDMMTDSEFDRGASVSTPPSVILRQDFGLCRPNGVAFVTDLRSWDECVDAVKIDKADRTAEFLGLAYDDGEPLALLRITAASINDWTMIRRPTLFDALDHWWWICWPDDPCENGHTLDLAGLVCRPAELKKGGREWVINDQSVNAANDKVVAVLLGRTLRSTKAEIRTDLWRSFCDLLCGDASAA